jgi:hypothetical protein
MRIQCSAIALLLASNALLSEAFTIPTPATSHAVSRSFRLNAVEKEFKNDGLFFFMEPALSLLGFKEGRTTYFGPTIDVDEKDFPSEEEQQARREKAEEEMFNIGQDERDRRRRGGEIAYKVAAAYAIASSLFLDDGSFEGHLARFGIVLPLFFAFGYTESADRGLWNVAQGGMWDVDGTGIRKIEDQDLARAFMEKVNAMNIETGRNALILAALFATLPHDLTAKFAGISLIIGSLYFASGKIPKSA